MTVGPTSASKTTLIVSDAKEWWNDYTTFPPHSTFEDYKIFTNDVIESYNHGHDWFRSSLDVGGDFHAIKREYKETNSLGPGPKHFGHYSDPLVPAGDHYYGDFWIRSNLRNEHFPPTVASSKSTLRALGTTAISRSSPTNPVSTLAVTIGEMVSEGAITPGGPLSAWRDSTAAARSAGSAYLNYDFGWKPLVSDIRKFCHAVKDHKTILKQYEDKSGHDMRVTYNFPSKDEFNGPYVDTGVYPSPTMSHLAIWDNIAGELTRFERKSTKHWFSGVFTYYLPPLSKRYDRFEAEANKLLGIRLTPDNLWKLAPWSWAADWFGNTGDTLHNIVNFQNDGLVLKHAYIMEEKSIVWDDTLRGLKLKSYPGVDMVLTRQLTKTTKRRVQASPYGFGITFDGFNDRQWATVVALGLANGSPI